MAIRVPLYRLLVHQGCPAQRGCAYLGRAAQRGCAYLGRAAQRGCARAEQRGRAYPAREGVKEEDTQSPLLLRHMPAQILVAPKSRDRQNEI